MSRGDDELAKLRKIVATLRGPGGCPWDREQTLRDIGRYLLEESCEFADAAREADGQPSPQVCDELGDVLMNVLLASCIAEETDAFSLDDVARKVREKLVRRHPHVFGDKRLHDAEEVLKQWEEIKARERSAEQGTGKGTGDRGFRSRLAGIPRSLPPLARAFKLSSRAARHGFDWPDPAGSLAKVQEEVGEVRSLLEGADQMEKNGPPKAPRERARLAEELGDLLFATVSLCRKLGIHPDDALRSTLKKFSERFEYIERQLPNLEEANLQEMDRLWDEMRSGSTRSQPPESG